MDIFSDQISAYNLVIVSYALGNPDHMKRAFVAFVKAAMQV